MDPILKVKKAPPAPKEKSDDAGNSVNPSPKKTPQKHTLKKLDWKNGKLSGVLRESGERKRLKRRRSKKRSEYTRRNIELCGRDQKRLNQQLSKLLGNSNVILPDMVNPEELATEFGEFFKAKIDKLQKKIGVKIEELGEKVSTESNAIEGETERFEKFSIMTEDEVASLVKSLPDKSRDRSEGTKVISVLALVGVGAGIKSLSHLVN
eukprot:sb/3470347/